MKWQLSVQAAFSHPIFGFIVAFLVGLFFQSSSAWFLWLHCPVWHRRYYFKIHFLIFTSTLHFAIREEQNSPRVLQLPKNTLVTCLLKFSEQNCLILPSPGWALMFKFSLQRPSMKQAEFGVMGWVDVEAVPKRDPWTKPPLPSPDKSCKPKSALAAGGWGSMCKTAAFSCSKHRK